MLQCNSHRFFGVGVGVEIGGSGLELERGWGGKGLKIDGRRWLMEKGCEKSEERKMDEREFGD